MTRPRCDIHYVKGTYPPSTSCHSRSVNLYSSTLLKSIWREPADLIGTPYILETNRGTYYAVPVKSSYSYYVLATNNMRRWYSVYDDESYVIDKIASMDPGSIEIIRAAIIESGNEL